MSTPTFRVSIVTQERVFFDAEVTSLQAPGGLGYLGVLANHAPLLTTLTRGTLTLTLADKTIRRFQVEGGFLEVARSDDGGQVTVLPDAISETTS
ncbi:MAG: hypothetical protein Kow0059_18640 [Candidatus Sumerlaeia bacterium]